MKTITRIRIMLPLPGRAVSPNATRTQSKGAALRKYRAIRAHRALAKLRMQQEMLALGLRQPVDWFTGYSLAFFWPTNQYRDDDNADASFKSYRDGIADALGIDDRHLRKCRLSTHAKDKECPRVEVTLWAEENDTTTNP